ncbi:rifin [Plasmodium reichenowi]|uniref:Rifin n=1 Tax=Plasmodium reichenowi TaxID=5854 RepID=A0A060RYZ0_PLARE|nr:rifin [Plasmodium reichenowi]
MKVHYINILLFALPLNILVNTHKKPSITPHYTPKIPTNRSLCECELYAPTNYDSDPQMKEVMQQFEDRTSQRLRDYDDRMIEKRRKCKDKCEKVIQKIILKDKLEKELMDKFATLQTDIQSDAIPTCVCEKSMADQVEKDCLRCGYGLGTVAPTVGLIGSVAVHMWKPKALEATIAAALKANTAKIAATAQAAGDAAGAAKVIDLINLKFGVSTLNGKELGIIFDAQNYNNVSLISGAINAEYSGSGCRSIFSVSGKKEPICTFVEEQIVATSGGNGFRVQGLGFRVQGSGFRVQGLGFRVQGLGFRVQGLGFRV